MHSAIHSSFSSLLNPYKEKVEEILKNYVPLMGDKSPVRDACEYALLGGGKRFRPALVLMMADSLGNNIDVSFAAIAIECFHTASLIADDLPCMDNDDERRNRPTVHKVFGETVALLASYALISAGYECLSKTKNDRVCRLAVENVSYNTGLYGATGGQFLDVCPPELSVETLREIIHKKTVSLFEISFVLGWLYGGGNIAKLDKIKKAASHFGIAFQIADDFDDMRQDIKNGRKVNLPNVCGVDVSKKMFHEELLAYRETLKELGLEGSALEELADVLNSKL